MGVHFIPGLPLGISVALSGKLGYLIAHMKMEVVMRKLLIATLAVLSFGLGTAKADPTRTVREATDVLDELAGIPLKGIPPAMLSDAHAVAIIPRVVNVGFVVAGRRGSGLVMIRDKTGAWSNPVFVNLTGASLGFQAGVQSTDVVLVFRSSRSLERLLEGRGKFTLGADASIAAGPVGRQAAIATDARLQSEIYSYSRSRGVFAGVSFDGSNLSLDSRTTDRFNNDRRESNQKAAAALRTRLAELSNTKDLPAPKTPGTPGTTPPAPTSPVPPAFAPPPPAAPQRMPERSPPPPLPM
jgi:lipid-binding SYLF domain-containing protein